MVPRELLYIADEVFFTGTAAEISPLRSVDRIKVGKGTRGPITKALQEEFFSILSGARPDRHNWLTPVSVPAGAATRLGKFVGASPLPMPPAATPHA